MRCIVFSIYCDYTLVYNVNFVILKLETKIRSDNGWIRTRAIAVVVKFFDCSTAVCNFFLDIILLVVAIVVYCEVFLSQIKFYIKAILFGLFCFVLYVLFVFCLYLFGFVVVVVLI